MKKLSIIIPCYNVENLIDRCLQSILDNNLEEGTYEIICIDDASKDGTLAKLLSWESSFPDIFKIVPCKENGRQGRARNIGIDLSSGEWISFVDADDWIEKDYFSKLFNQTFLHDSLDIVVCQSGVDFAENLVYFKNYGDTNSDNYDSSCKKDNTYKDTIDRWVGDKDRDFVLFDGIQQREKMILGQYFGGVWAKIVKRDLLLSNNLYFSEGLVYEDVEWRELLHLFVNKGVIIRDKLYHYYMNPTSTVRGNNRENHYDYTRILVSWWDRWTATGMLQQFYIPMIHEFLLAGFMQALRCYILRFDKPSYDRFLELKDVVNERIPKEDILLFLEEPYSSAYPFSELQKMLLKLLYLPIGEEEYSALADSLKHINF